jgi:hypothetical protein
MKLMLSSLAQGEAMTRRVIEQLLKTDIPVRDMIVLHPGRELTPQSSDGDAAGIASARSGAHANKPAGQSASVVGAAASSGVMGGMVGWLLGFGILAVPGAMVGGTLGAVAGATLGMREHKSVSNRIPAAVHHHYANSIIDDRVAILIQVSDFTQYQAALEIFLANGCQHILTSNNQPTEVESEQLAALAHHPPG